MNLGAREREIGPESNAYPVMIFKAASNGHYLSVCLAIVFGVVSGQRTIAIVHIVV